MKVALLSDCYPPRLGGIESQVRDLARHLLGAGHEVEVFTATPGAAGERHGVIEVEDGVPVHRMALRLPLDLPVNPLATREIHRRLEAGSFDVAHVHMGVVSPFATDLADLTTRIGLPTAVTWHCVLGPGSAIVLRRLGRARAWARRGAALSAVSQMAAGRVASLLDPGTQVAVVPNAIDLSAWRPADVARDAPADVPRGGVHLVSALRLAPRKRVPALLGILAAARRSVPDSIPMTATIYGEGPLRSLLQRRLDHGGMDWVALAGRVTRPELARAYAAADAFVSPARLEAFGLAALEARTAGLPVVAVAGSGVEDFVTEGVEGLLGRSDEELAAAVVRLARDPLLRERIREHNLAVEPAQCWPAVIDVVLADYRRAGAINRAAGLRREPT